MLVSGIGSLNSVSILAHLRIGLLSSFAFSSPEICEGEVSEGEGERANASENTSVRARERERGETGERERRETRNKSRRKKSIEETKCDRGSLVVEEWRASFWKPGSEARKSSLRPFRSSVASGIILN